MTTTTPVPPPVPLKDAAASLSGLIEKAVLTFIEAFVAGLVMNQTDWLVTDNVNLLWLASACAAATVLANGAANLLIPTTLPIWAQTALRVIRTFAATFFTFLVAQPSFTLNPDTVTAACVAGIAAALTLVKALIASRVGNHATTALLPASLDSKQLVIPSVS